MKKVLILLGIVTMFVGIVGAARADDSLLGVGLALLISTVLVYAFQLIRENSRVSELFKKQK